MTVRPSAADRLTVWNLHPSNVRTDIRYVRLTVGIDSLTV